MLSLDAWECLTGNQKQQSTRKKKINGPQNDTHKTKNWATRTSQQSRCYRCVSSSASLIGTSRGVVHVKNPMRIEARNGYYEERHIPSPRQRSSETVSEVVVAGVKLSKWWFYRWEPFDQ